MIRRVILCNLAALIVKCYVCSFDPSSLIMVLEKAAKQWYLYCVQLIDEAVGNFIQDRTLDVFEIH
jgi:hypothetical protein